jgi:hypothetical protein
MTNEKVTYKSAVQYVLENLTNAPAEISEKLTALLASLEAKSNAERKPTAKQNANESYKADILAFMEPNHLYTVQDVFKGVESWANDDTMTAARVSALLTQLKRAELIVREEDKRKAYFRLA